MTPVFCTLETLDTDGNYEPAEQSNSNLVTSVMYSGGFPFESSRVPLGKFWVNNSDMAEPFLPMSFPGRQSSRLSDWYGQPKKRVSSLRIIFHIALKLWAIKNIKNIHFLELIRRLLLVLFRYYILISSPEKNRKTLCLPCFPRHRPRILTTSTT